MTFMATVVFIYSFCTGVKEAARGTDLLLSKLRNHGTLIHSHMNISLGFTAEAQGASASTRSDKETGCF
jgi:hypothetical protein